MQQLLAAHVHLQCLHGNLVMRKAHQTSWTHPNTVTPPYRSAVNGEDLQGIDTPTKRVASCKQLPSRDICSVDTLHIQTMTLETKAKKKKRCPCFSNFSTLVKAHASVFTSGSMTTIATTKYNTSEIMTKWGIVTCPAMKIQNP